MTDMQIKNGYIEQLLDQRKENSYDTEFSNIMIKFQIRRRSILFFTFHREFLIVQKIKLKETKNWKDLFGTKINIKQPMI